jgi:5'-deoxynucleotidase YfbR-like HD superfamily hydrolase
MKHLTKLFHLLEITRNQPQYGYAIWGGNTRLGNLAEHHYMVAMVAWQLASSVNAAGAHLDIGKVFEFASIHDIGELFGGDISMPYAKANPKARSFAKQFEAENHNYIAKFFGPQARHFSELSAEIMKADSDEARIVKVADYLEVTHYKFFIGRFVKADVELVSKKLDDMIAGMKDKVAKKELASFIKDWKKEMQAVISYPDTIHEIISSSKQK